MAIEGVPLITLKGRTLRGKNIIRLDGNRWHVWRRDNVPCFGMGPGVLISPQDHAWHDNRSRWVHASETDSWRIDDPDFEVVEEKSDAS